MTFGPYKDFDDCVGKNSDKENPQAYCAVVKERIEGASNHSTMVFSAAAPYAFKQGIPIFTVGKHRSSTGKEKDWSESELRGMVNAFNKQVPPLVPIRFGHTEDNFTKEVARELGVPVSLLRGEDGTQRGLVGIGEIVGLNFAQGAIHADVICPPAVQTMMDNGFLKSLSAELILDYKDASGKSWGPVISGIALLGAERPALEELNRVLQAHSAEEGYWFSLEDKGGSSGKLSWLDKTEKPDVLYTILRLVAEGTISALDGWRQYLHTGGDPSDKPIKDLIEKVGSTRGFNAEEDKQPVSFTGAESEDEPFSTGPVVDVPGDPGQPQWAVPASSRNRRRSIVVHTNAATESRAKQIIWDQIEKIADALGDTLVGAVRGAILGRIALGKGRIRSRVGTGLGILDALRGKGGNYSEDPLFFAYLVKVEGGGRTESYVVDKNSPSEAEQEASSKAASAWGLDPSAVKVIGSQKIDVPSNSPLARILRGASSVAAVALGGLAGAGLASALSGRPVTEGIIKHSGNPGTSKEVPMKKLMYEEGVEVGAPQTPNAEDILKSLMEMMGVTTAAELLEKVRGMAAPQNNGNAGGGTPEDGMVMQAQFQAKISGLEQVLQSKDTVISAQGKEIAALQRRNRIADWSTKVANFSAVAGTMEEHATQLSDLEEKAGKVVADQVYSAWKSVQETADAQRLRERTLAPNSPAPSSQDHPFVNRIKEVAATRKLDYNDRRQRAEAFTAASEQYPREYLDYVEVIRAPSRN